MVDRTKLAKAYDEITARILEVVESPKPSYNIDGKEVEWAEYLDILTKSQASLRKQLIIADSDPFEVSQTMII